MQRSGGKKICVHVHVCTPMCVCARSLSLSWLLKTIFAWLCRSRDANWRPVVLTAMKMGAGHGRASVQCTVRPRHAPELSTGPINRFPPSPNPFVSFLQDSMFEEILLTQLPCFFFSVYQCLFSIIYNSQIQKDNCCMIPLIWST